MRPRQIVGPLILIALGTLFLLSNFVAGLSLREFFRDWWPAILIVVGLMNLAGAVFAGAGAWGRIHGGVILIAVGALFQLQQLGYASFGRTWPVLLVVVGALGLLRVVLGPLFFVGRMARLPRRGFFR